MTINESCSVLVREISTTVVMVQLIPPGVRALPYRENEVCLLQQRLPQASKFSVSICIACSE
jgi:hypothetical protein